MNAKNSPCLFIETNSLHTQCKCTLDNAWIITSYHHPVSSADIRATSTRMHFCLRGFETSTPAGLKANVTWLFTYTGCKTGLVGTKRDVRAIRPITSLDNAHESLQQLVFSAYIGKSGIQVCNKCTNVNVPSVREWSATVVFRGYNLDGNRFENSMAKDLCGCKLFLFWNLYLTNMSIWGAVLSLMWYFKIF